MVRVLHIVLGLEMGGLEKLVLGLIGNYSSDVEPYIVCLEQKGILGQACNICPIYEFDKKPGIDLLLVKQLYDLVKKKKIGIIHTHNPSPHFYGSLTGLLAGIPVIHSKHGRNYPGNSRKILINRIISYLTAKVVAVSQNAADVCLQVEKVPVSKVDVILNGVDTKVFSPKAESYKKSEDATVGIVARLSAEKDHSTLLHACKILNDQSASFRLLIVGDGPLRESLQTAAQELGIERNVEFMGMRNDIADLLHSLDLFVLSSTTEGISLTLLEAMASGLPIVATDVGGNPEVVVDGKTGYLVPAKDPVAMASKINWLLEDGNLRKIMGLEGRKRVVENFSIKQTARQYESLYREVLENGK